MHAVALIGHRGASHEAPENTLASFRLAWERGADGIEGDFRLTADGKIVCIHDATTKRTTGLRLPVAGSTLAQLRKLDAGQWKGKEWSGEVVPTIEEVIATVPRGKKLFMELKTGPEVLLPLKKVMADSGFNPDQARILAFDEEVIAEARLVLPEVKALWITAYKKRSWEWRPTPDMILQTLNRTGASGLASQAHLTVDAAFVRALHEAGREFHVWTVNDPRSAARFMALGADSITTNRPGWLRSELQRWSRVRKGWAS